MLFNSIGFLAFFPLVLVSYAITPPKLRWLLLLAASYFFYMCWRPEFALLILFSTVIDYFVGLGLGRDFNERGRKALLALSLTVNLGLLFAFKYLGFATESLQSVLEFLRLEYQLPFWNLALPVGISFYTFQTLSYSIDVYLRRIEPERHFGRFALYVSFFPQLVAGPIERSERLLPQLNNLQAILPDNILPGLEKIVWGFFKKLVVADRVAICVNAVYSSPENQSGPTLLVATVLFAFQIYCDFSGYSDIAIGCARILGIDLMENFRRPYFSTSIGEFWQRWHISLSTWFRDYVYIPLGGNRVSPQRWLFNIIVVFAVSGIWHGANWTFVIWGLLHSLGLLVAMRFSFPRWQSTFAKVCAAMMTFGFVCIAWVFFRAETVADAWTILTKIPTTSGGLRIPGIGIFHLIHALLAIGLLLAVELFQEIYSHRRLSPTAFLGRELKLATLVTLIGLLGVFNGSQFIYFQF